MLGQTVFIPESIFRKNKKMKVIPWGEKNHFFLKKLFIKIKKQCRNPEGNAIFGANGGDFWAWRYVMGIDNSHRIVLDRYF